MKLKVFTWSIFIVFFVIFPATALENASPVIDASNIHQLQSVTHIDFANLPEAAGKIENGWFAITPDGNNFATLDREYGIVLWNITSGFVKVSVAQCDSSGTGSFIDGAFATRLNEYVDKRFWWFIAAYQTSDGYMVGYHSLDADPGKPVVLCSTAAEIPIRVWGSTNEAETGGLNWLEIIPSDSTTSPSVWEFPILVGLDPSGDAPSSRIPSGPENDPDSFMRIGRIDPPLAITATKDALLKRRNLETGEVTASTQLDGLPAAGQVNANGSSFSWVDQKFELLRLLNFETGEDKVIAPLGGTYIPFLLLSAKADVIIGVNVGLEPDVTAWDAVTGERMDLGGYRACSRQPDMVRLSKDGSTLVIGCDTGLDIWRVAEAS